MAMGIPPPDTPAEVHSVVIIDDHDIVRFGLGTLIGFCKALRLVGSAPTLAEGLRLISQHQPDLVISDLSLEDSKGLDTLRAVVQAQAPRAVLVISMHDEMLYGEQVLALGARGYVMKENAHAVTEQAALAVLRGETWISPELNARLLNRLLQRSRPAPLGDPSPSRTDASQALSTRELEVLEVLRTGKTTKEIAFQLGLSARTVDIHRANIKRKLGLRSGAELIAYALSRT